LVHRDVATWNGAVSVNDSALTSQATSLTRAPGETVAGGPYAITAGAFTAASTNYSAPRSEERREGKVTTAWLSAQVTSQAKAYSSDDPMLGVVPVTLSGLVDTAVTTWNGVTATLNDTGLTSQATSLTRAPGETVAAGPYAITAGVFTAASTNYSAP